MPPRKMTPAAIQQMIDEGVAAALASQAGVPQNVGPARAQAVPNNHFCTSKEFMDCKPITFKGTEGAVGLTQWFEKVESVFHRSNCTENNRVKYATGTLLEHALSWWNAYVQEKGMEEAYNTSWEDFKKAMVKK